MQMLEVWMCARRRHKYICISMAAGPLKSVAVNQKDLSRHDAIAHHH